MLLAAECMCASPREFERGWCHRCGRLLAVEPWVAENLDGWLRLDLTIEREARKVRQFREALGLDDRQYAAWLRSELGKNPTVSALSEENASPGASRRVGTAVPG